MSHRWTKIWPLTVFVLLAFSAQNAAADVFVLATGGEIRGELVNRDESPRERFVIRPYAGGEITVAAVRVTDVITQKPVEAEYDRVRLERDDSVTGHWQLAEWCHEKGLRAQRTSHLQRVIELENDHAEARRLLGFEKVNGVWMTRDEVMAARGLVKFKGRWVLQQEVKIIEARRRQKQLELDWYRNVNLWTGWLDGSKRERGRENLLAISDPNAVKAIVARLDDAKRLEYKDIFATALANIGTETAIARLVEATLEDPDEDFRYACLEHLAKKRPPSAVAVYLQALKSKDNTEVNRAGLGLATMRDPTTIESLIDALITTHKYKIGKDNKGQMSLGFGGRAGNSGSSFSSGGTAKIITGNQRNEQVLGALVELTDRDFHYDVEAWRNWYATQKPAEPKINSRRDK